MSRRKIHNHPKHKQEEDAALGVQSNVSLFGLSAYQGARKTEAERERYRAKRQNGPVKVIMKDGQLV